MANPKLWRIPRTYPLLLSDMANHYSMPRGFVGRNICYAITYDGKYYGSIVGGSTPQHLIGRLGFLGKIPLTNIVNNLFFHISKIDGKYPIRNFAVNVLRQFRESITRDWKAEYKCDALAFETLVELPRTGEVYKRDKWSLIGVTEGFCCKRVGGISTDGYTGRRVWDTVNKRPKYVFARLNG